jgi:hypothetical protein
VRHRQFVRNTRREDQRIQIADIGRGVGDQKSLSLGGIAREPGIIPTGYHRAHAGQRAQCRDAGAAQAHHRVTPSGKDIGGKTHQRIFNVARPHRARIMDTIQKRMTMVGSAHPFFSK